MFTQKDRQQLSRLEITEEKFQQQIECFEAGLHFTKLAKPCTPGDGIVVIPAGRIQRLIESFSNAALDGRTMKFVPASGAATRMFKSLQSAYHNFDRNGKPNGEAEVLSEFVQNLKKYAFYDDLKTAMQKDHLDLENATHEDGFQKSILEYLLTQKGLDYSCLPKGLIKFHRYEDQTRTAFEEHLIEASNYTLDKNKNTRLHFTLSSECYDEVKRFLDDIKRSYSSGGIDFTITLSMQKPSTNTIAVDSDNQPIRTEHGDLLFRPAGHGALLENLNEVDGDIVFIKNVDNVVPDHLKESTYRYKKIIGGYLVDLQTQVFNYMQLLEWEDIDPSLINEIFEFAEETLAIIPPEGMLQANREEQRMFLFGKLNRPIRVCGMVKNEGKAGGGPFWVENGDKSMSMQIIESSQVNVDSQTQSEIWQSSTYFNPVDLVCGIRNYKGQSFDLRQFINLNTAFISNKSTNGREIKALELPGLWNGSMAFWNTVFIEVPLSTFNPVKTVFDLLREEHQPKPDKPEISNLK